MFRYKWMSSKTVYVSTRLGKKDIYIPLPVKLMKELPESLICRITIIDRNNFKIKFTKRFP